MNDYNEADGRSENAARKPHGSGGFFGEWVFQVLLVIAVVAVVVDGVLSIGSNGPSII